MKMYIHRYFFLRNYILSESGSQLISMTFALPFCTEYHMHDKSNVTTKYPFHFFLFANTLNATLSVFFSKGLTVFSMSFH